MVWQVKDLDPYGRIQLEPGAQLNLCLRFAGHYYDEHLQLNYNRFRDYDPLLGRYLQPDPIGHDGGVNLYAYPTNPLVEVDLRGLFHRAKRKAKQRSKQRKKREHKKKKAQAAENKALDEKRKAARGGQGEPKVQKVKGLSDAEVAKLNENLAGIHNRSKDGEFNKKGGKKPYHGDTEHGYSVID
ncbi:RHS repeat-associated core domain-containing protein [Myxococcota bacterium]